jgi:hypothetical protein
MGARLKHRALSWWRLARERVPGLRVIVLAAGN